YAPVSELSTALGRDPAAGGAGAVWLAEAGRVWPGLRAIYAGVPPAPDAPTDSIRLRVAEAVTRMMEAVADNGPVLLAFDDLQFLDPASREVLFLITRRLERVPTLIVAGARAGDAELRPEETGHGGLVWKETIHLQPLDRSQALNLIRDHSGDSEDVSSQIAETIVRLAQGNPYHLEMLLADWRTHRAQSLAAAESSEDSGPISWTPPEDLRAAFARQYGGLSTDAQHVLQLLSVAGKAMVPSELASLLGLQDGVVVRAPCGKRGGACRGFSGLTPSLQVPDSACSWRTPWSRPVSTSEGSMPSQTGSPMQHPRPIWPWRPCSVPRHCSALVWAATRPSSRRRRRRLRWRNGPTRYGSLPEPTTCDWKSVWTQETRQRERKQSHSPQAWSRQVQPPSPP